MAFFSEILFPGKGNRNIPMITGHNQGFGASLFFFGKITRSFFDMRLDGKIFIQASHCTGDMAVFGREAQCIAYIQELKGEVTAVR